MQAGGALAMIVANFADEITSLGAYSDSDVAAVTIPLVLVTEPDGSALRAAVEGGATVALEIQPYPYPCPFPYPYPYPYPYPFPYPYP